LIAKRSLSYSDDWPLDLMKGLSKSINADLQALGSLMKHRGIDLPPDRSAAAGCAVSVVRRRRQANTESKGATAAMNQSDTHRSRCSHPRALSQLARGLWA
jgi:hypothetical protein